MNEAINHPLHYGGQWINETSEHAPAYYRHHTKEFCTCTLPKAGMVIEEKVICGNCFLTQDADRMAAYGRTQKPLIANQPLITNQNTQGNLL